MHQPPTPPCPSQLWCNTSGSPAQINTAWSPEHFSFMAQSKVRTSGGIFMSAEPTFHLNAKGQSFIFRKGFVPGVLFYDHLQRLLRVILKLCSKNGVSLCNLPLPRWLERSLTGKYVHCVVSVSMQRGICVWAWMFTTLWPRCVTDSCTMNTCVCVCERECDQQHSSALHFTLSSSWYFMILWTGLMSRSLSCSLCPSCCRNSWRTE